MNKTEKSKQLRLKKRNKKRKRVNKHMKSKLYNDLMALYESGKYSEQEFKDLLARIPQST